MRSLFFMTQTQIQSDQQPINTCQLSQPTLSMQSFFNKLGNENKGGFAAGKAPFWERPAFVLWTQAQPDPAAAEAALAEDNDFKGWKAKYDRSRRTVTRTGEPLTSLVCLPAKHRCLQSAQCIYGLRCDSADLECNVAIRPTG